MPNEIGGSKRALRARDVASIAKISIHTLYKVIKDHSIGVIQQGNKKLLPPDSVRKVLEVRGFQFKNAERHKPLVINLSCMKGGIGKTTLATAIAEGSSRLGFRVLVVDLDMQGNTTESFGKKSQTNIVMHDVFSEERTLDEAIIQVEPYLDIIPSTLKNSKSDLFLSSQELHLPNYFSSLFEPCYDNYDLIILDCAPTVNKVTTCAAFLSDINLIPINADVDSYEGVKMTVQHLAALKRNFSEEEKLQFKIVFNKYDAREKLSLEILGKVANEKILQDNLLSIVVRTDTGFKNTKALGLSIYDLPKSSGREDCLNLISELTGINQWAESTSKSKSDAGLEIA